MIDPLLPLPSCMDGTADPGELHRKQKKGELNHLVQLKQKFDFGSNIGLSGNI